MPNEQVYIKCRKLILYQCLWTEKSSPQQSTARCCSSCDSENSVDLVDDHISDQVDKEILNKSSVCNTVPTTFTRRGILRTLL